MSDEIKKICNNCDNLQYGFGESSINYGPRCFEKDCGVDENDTCDMFEIASYLKVKKLQEQNKILREALEDFRDNGTRHDTNPTGQFKKCGCFDSFKGDSWQSYIRSQDSSVKERAREALARVKE